MNIPAVLPLHLLHRNLVGALATHSRSPDGFPYPTVVPFALDARHRPVILISGLAEHTRNLNADPRAGLLIADGLGASDSGATDSTATVLETTGSGAIRSRATGARIADPSAGGPGGDTRMRGDVLNRERMTLLGCFSHIDADAHTEQRYLRYYPDGARYVAFGDFAFWRLDAERLRYIAGFGQMGWLDGSALDTLAPLSFDEERTLWSGYETSAIRRVGLDLLGVDRYGADWRANGAIVRTPFEAPKTDVPSLAEALRVAVDRLTV